MIYQRPYSRQLGDAPTTAAAAAAPAQVEEPYVYVFDIALTANQTQTDLSRDIDKDSDFILYSIYGTSTGAYLVSLRNYADRSITSSPIRNDNFVGSVQFPNPIGRPLWFPRGGRIPIDLWDKSGAPNSVELCFKGIRLFDRK